MKRIRFKGKIVSILLFFFILLTSCALRPISPKYTLLEPELEKIKIENLGNGKILIYNGANIFHRMDNTARLNIWIENKPLGQIRAKEYTIINLENGKYTFTVLHIDVFNMRSNHNLKIDDETKIIRIEPTLTSNKITITNEFPNKFHKYNYMKNR